MALFDAKLHSQLPLDLMAIATDYHTHYDQYDNELARFEQHLQYDLHLPPLNRSQLFMFLKCKEFNMDVAGKTLDKYFTMRTSYKDIFHKRCVGSNRSNTVLDLAQLAFYPTDKLHDGGYRLALFRLKSFDSSKLDFMDGLRALTAAMDLEIARTPYLPGIIMILDMTGMNMGHLTKVNIIGLAHFMAFVQNCGLKLGAVHVINCNSLIKNVMTLLRPFLTATLVSVLYFYTPTQMNEFYQVIPQSLMPSDYGGKIASVSELDDQFRIRLLEAKEWISNIEAKLYQVDETKRKSTEAYVFEESFRKLEID